MKTRITDLFGIQYPIIQGAMQWLSKPKLAAAVSNAGGLGTINMTTYDTPEAFQQDIQLLKTLTDKPFCVNLSLLPDTKPDGPIKGFLQAIKSICIHSLVTVDKCVVKQRLRCLDLLRLL